MQADMVVELLGDNPLVHSELIDDVLDFHLAGGFDYSASVTTEYSHAEQNLAKFPLGIRVQVFDKEALAKCHQLQGKIQNRERTTNFIYEHPDVYKIGYFEAKEKWACLQHPNLNFAVNYQQNFDLINHIFELCYEKNVNFTLQSALRVLDENPELAQWMGPPIN